MAALPEDYSPIYFRHSQIVKAHDLIDSHYSSQSDRDKYRRILQNSMDTMVSNARIMYDVIKSKTEELKNIVPEKLRHTSSIDFSSTDHQQTVDCIVEQFYIHAPTALQFFTSDTVLIEAWNILCSDIGRRY